MDMLLAREGEGLCLWLESCTVVVKCLVVLQLTFSLRRSKMNEDDDDLGVSISNAENGINSETMNRKKLKQIFFIYKCLKLISKQ